MSFDPDLKARLTLDEEGRIRGISHIDEFWRAEDRQPRRAALSYLRTVADRLEIPPQALEFAHQSVEFLRPELRGTEYRLSEEKAYFDATTEGFYQTCLNVPVWGAGVTVTMKASPTRVVSAVNTSLYVVSPKMPPDDVIEKWRKLFLLAEREQALRKIGEKTDTSETAPFIGDMLIGRIFRGGTGKAAVLSRQQAAEARLLSGRFFIYRYDPARRFSDARRPPVPPMGEIEAVEDAEKSAEAQLVAREPAARRMDHAPEEHPTLKIADAPNVIEPGADYMVAELVFFYPTQRWGRINWRALVELETGAILYLRPLADSVNGLVFEADPITESGSTANGPTATNAVLNPFRDDVTLPNLNAPVGGTTQHLAGTHVTLSEEENPVIAAPTVGAGSDFDYQVRTNNFAAVNAYYNVNRFFDLVEDLGFNRATYFGGTSFPVPVDHRGLGDSINAHCVGTGSGIDHLCFALADDTNLANPMGIAADWRVHLHELGGHGILHDHVGGPNFGFAHSAGDSFAMILSDPESNAPDRFHLSPFVPVITRRSDRGPSEWSVATVTVTNGGSGYSSPPSVAISGGGGSGAEAYVPSWAIAAGAITYIAVRNPGTGYTSAPTVTITGGGGSGATATSAIGTWAWQGGMDLGSYLSEQILSTTLFRAYRSIGGDSPDLSRRQFAARYMAYLIFRTVGTLTMATNPATARAFANSLIATDALNWTSEGIDGGAYGKVIEWAFEKQGLYKPGAPVPALGTVISEGSPPDVDVYIDDGRAGEYQYQWNHWSTTAIWNRLHDDGGTTHEQPDSLNPNYIYVRVKNRGTQTANNVVVKGYHTKPGAGLSWPADFEPMTTAQIAVGSLGPNNTDEQIIGPFEWTPNINAYGHDCILMVVSATDDPSNIDNFTAGESIPEWRLVPNDNNVGQRNVHPVPGGGGSGGLIAGLHGFSLWIGNPNSDDALMEVEVRLPGVLTQRRWRLGFQGLRVARFRLKPRERRELILDLDPGASFSKADVEATDDRDIVVAVKADGGVIGGMTYSLDPTIERPTSYPGRPRPEEERRHCIEEAKRLLECLDLPSDKVCKVAVEKIILGVRMKDDDCC